jgi:hypothetical protein
MYNIACVYSLRNNAEPALRWLERSIDNGFTDLDHMREDPDLDNIRDNPKYIELIEGVSSDVDSSGAEEKPAIKVSG